VGTGASSCLLTGNHYISVVVPFNLFDETIFGVSNTNDAMPIGFIPAMVLLTVICLVRTERLPNGPHPTSDYW